MRRSRRSAPSGNAEFVGWNTGDYFAEVDREGRRLPPELFRTTRRLRRTRIRLVVEVALLAVATVVMLLAPNLGEIILAVVLGIVALYDLLLYLYLRRQVRHAWEDLALGLEQ